MKKGSVLISTLLVSLLFSTQVFAAEFTTTPASKVMYTIANTQVYAQPDASTVPLLVAGADAPVQITGITSNGWYQVSVGGVYYVPGDQLTDISSQAVAPINTRNYQMQMSANINSVAEMQTLVNQALDAHAYTVNMTSNMNIFNSTSTYIESLIGGQLGTYNIHGCNGYHLNRRNNNYTITFEYLATIEEEQAVDAFVQENCRSFVGADTKETIKNVHDYICNLTEYSNTSAAGQADFKSPYDAIVSHETVCTGYALLFQKYMDVLGIPCYTAAGYRNGGPHMWNVVNVNGQWYHIDCTWDDQKTYVSNRWFLCGADTAGYGNWGNVTLAATTLK